VGGGAGGEAEQQAAGRRSGTASSRAEEQNTKQPGGAGPRPPGAQWTGALLLRGDEPAKWTNAKLARHIGISERGCRRGLARIRVKKRRW
jgi:hypothetical protein